MKVCAMCGETKGQESFRPRSDRPHLLASYCKPCQAAYSRQHYEANKPEVIKRNASTSKSSRQRLKRMVCEFLETHPCVDCGESDPNVLEFDHVSGEKTTTVSEAVRRRLSVENIFREIAKCEVRCANCHRRRTASQFGWSKSA